MKRWILTAPADFVSSAAEQSGVVQGEAAAKYWKEHPEADRNGNGNMEQRHADGADWKL